MQTIKAFLGIAAIVAVIFAAVRIVPVEVSNYGFQDDLRNIAMMGSSNLHQTDQETLAAVLKKAQEREIVLAPEQVTVQRIGTPGVLGVYVAADYSVPIDLEVYSFTLHFTPNSGNK
jgi:hypothetical protein